MDLFPHVATEALGGDTALSVAASALVLGASGSLHCFLMCGPLACSAAPGGARNLRALGAYHLSRVIAYALVGGFLGVFGRAFSRAFTLPMRAIVPWLLVAALLGSALDIGKRLAPLPGLAHFVRRLARLGATFSPTRRAAVLGGITPLLPCGLLYGVFAAAFSVSSFADGALLLGSFAVGGAPALLLAQLPAGLATRLRGTPALILRRGLPLVAAAVLAVRAVQSARGHACH
jgi:sulfite exporter TauE/SafE